jgi:hypothetical protein
MKFRKEGIYMGSLSQIPEYEMKITDSELIRRAVEALENQ